MSAFRKMTAFLLTAAMLLALACTLLRGAPAVAVRSWVGSVIVT